jgi:DNA-binding XRE family transcriptional regulator
MTIRYQRAPTGYRVERVPTTAPAEEPQSPEAAALVVATALRQFALSMEAERRRRELTVSNSTTAPFGRRPPRGRVYDGPVTAEDLVRARAITGLSQRDLAEAEHVHRSTVAEVERGLRRPPERLAGWAAGVLRARGLQPGGVTLPVLEDAEAEEPTP